MINALRAFSCARARISPYARCGLHRYLQGFQLKQFIHVITQTSASDLKRLSVADFGVTFFAQIWAKNPDLEDSSFFPRRCCKEGRSKTCGLHVDYTRRCVLQPFKEEGFKTIRIFVFFVFLYFLHFCNFCLFRNLCNLGAWSQNIIRVPVCLSVCLSVSLSVCLAVCLYVHVHVHVHVHMMYVYVYV